MVAGEITSTYVGTFEWDSAVLTGSLDTLCTSGATAEADINTIHFVPLSNGLNVAVYTLSRSSS